MKDARGHGSASHAAHQAAHQLKVHAIGRLKDWGGTLRSFAKNETGAGQLPVTVQHDVMTKMHGWEPDDLHGFMTDLHEKVGVSHIAQLAHFLTVMGTLAVITIMVQHFIS